MIFQRPQIDAICAYRDVSGIFTKNVEGEAEVVEPQEDKSADEPMIIGNVDNEDDLLYGDVPAFQMPIIQPTKPQDAPTKKQPWWQKHLQEIKPTYWLLVYRDSGTLEIYSLPDLRLSYLIRNFGYGQYILHDSMESTSLHSSQVNEIPSCEMRVRQNLYCTFVLLPSTGRFVFVDFL